MTCKRIITNSTNHICFNILLTNSNSLISTFSTFIYKDAVKGGLTPSLRALSTLIFVVVLTLLFFINLRSNKQKGGRKA